MADRIPSGLCQCGCGERTKLARRTSTEKGWKRGEPLRYVNGHNRRIHDFAYDVEPQSGCWLWRGSLTWNGYGQGKENGVGVLAHRWYYEQANGAIPDGLSIDHLCRNRRCVNPAHLEPVTGKENARRGRATILTAGQVQRIKRASYYRGLNRDLADEYGVARCTISAIRCGRLWPDVT